MKLDKKYPKWIILGLERQMWYVFAYMWISAVVSDNKATICRTPDIRYRVRDCGRLIYLIRRGKQNKYVWMEWGGKKQENQVE